MALRPIDTQRDGSTAQATVLKVPVGGDGSTAAEPAVGGTRRPLPLLCQRTEQQSVCALTQRGFVGGHATFGAGAAHLYCTSAEVQGAHRLPARTPQGVREVDRSHAAFRFSRVRLPIGDPQRRAAATDAPARRGADAQDCAESSAITTLASFFGATIVYEVRTHSSTWRQRSSSASGAMRTDTHPWRPRP